MIVDTVDGGRDLNLAVLFLSDIGVPPDWDEATIEDVSEELEDAGFEIIFHGKEVPDMVMRIPEGTKVWEAQIELGRAWRNVTRVNANFIPRSARSLAITCNDAKAAHASMAKSKRKTSTGLVFMDTHGVEAVLKEECDRLSTSLLEAFGDTVLLMSTTSPGDLLVFKEGGEGDSPSFTKVARIVHDCYQTVLGRGVQTAGRGMKKSLSRILSLYPGTHGL